MTVQQKPGAAVERSGRKVKFDEIGINLSKSTPIGHFDRSLAFFAVRSRSHCVSEEDRFVIL